MFTEIERLHFTTIESTNTWAKQHVSKLALDKITVITASEQTVGRGRFDRKWLSPVDQNVYATYCFSLPNAIKMRNVSTLSLVLAISAAQILQRLNFKVELKWPNDLLLKGKKVGGLLCETLTVDGRLWVFLGIGLNINMPLELLDQIDQPATSLLIQTGKQQEVESILKQLNAQFIAHLNQFLEQGFTPFLDVYRKLICYQSGQKLTYRDGVGSVEGMYHSIDADGALNLLLSDGGLKKIVAGEIHLISPKAKSSVPEN